MLAKLAHPNVASKHWVIRQYDHEVQGGTVVKPLVGPRQVGSSDAAVIRPKPTSRRGVVLANGLAPHIDDPYEMAIAAVDEAIRNAVCVGATLDRLAILDNFCWPGTDDELTMGTLVRACEGCRDAALGYGVPFVSGKDSLHNQFTDAATGKVTRIPRTLLVSAIGVVEDVGACVTMDLKRPGSVVALIRPKEQTIEGRARLHRAVSAEVARRAILALHDVSDGGPFVALAEMCIASGLGLGLDFDALGQVVDPFDDRVLAYYVVEFSAVYDTLEIGDELHEHADVRVIGWVNDRPEWIDDPQVAGGVASGRWRVSVDEMTRAWRGTLDW